MKWNGSNRETRRLQLKKGPNTNLLIVVHKTVKHNHSHLLRFNSPHEYIKGSHFLCDSLSLRENS